MSLPSPTFSPHPALPSSSPLLSVPLSLTFFKKKSEALEKHKECITFIDQVMNIHVSYPEDDGDAESFHEACKMIQKLKKTKTEVLTRIQTIEAKQEQSHIRPENTQNLITYAELAQELNNIDSRAIRASNTYIIYVNDNVRVYYINDQGSVTSNLESQRFTIFGTDGDIPNKFLQVQDWIYPLVPGVSPCFKTEYGAFIFPDINSNQQIGIVLPEEEAEIIYDLLTNILQGVVVQHGEHRPEVVGLDEKISSKIIAGARFVADGIVSSSTRFGTFLDTSIQPPPPTHPAANIPDYVQTGAKITEATTSTTAKVVGFVADKIGIATTKLGQYLAAHIQAQGIKLLQSTFNYTEDEALKKVKSVLTVAGGAVEGFSTIYFGLETTARILRSGLRDNTVKIVESKYGSPAGDVALNSLNAVFFIMIFPYYFW